MAEGYESTIRVAVKALKRVVMESGYLDCQLGFREAFGVCPICGCAGTSHIPRKESK